MVKLQDINSITPTNKVYIAKSTIPHAGRGVFAKKAINKGESIEVCPVIVLSKDEWFESAHIILADYYFHWLDSNFSVCMVLGFGSLYNNSKTPDADFKRNFEARTMSFFALNDIKKDQEIFISYSGKQL